MKYRVSVSADVLAQILSISSSFEGARERLGEEFEAEVDELFQSIAVHPYMYVKEYGPIRRGLIRRFNIVVFYTVAETTIGIIEVRDARQKKPNWRARGYRNN